jgi:hypothetical protein
MKWPSQLLIRIVSRKTKQGVENLLFYVLILAERKNDYALGPFLTDRRGEVTLSKEQVLQAIQKAQQEFAMDYADDLEQCKDLISVIIDNKDVLHERLNRLNKYYPEAAERLRTLLKKAANSNVKSIEKEIEITLSTESVEIEVELVPKE